MSSGVRITDDGPIRVVEIDRAQTRNAIDRQCGRAIRDAWLEFDDDESLRVGILAGRNGIFCSGADYNDMEGLERDFWQDEDGFMCFTRLSLSKPVIAAVSGMCAGIEVALWCDLRIADASAMFSLVGRSFGRPMLDGGTQRLPRIVGLGRALDIILTGRVVEAEEARQMGLVNQVVPVGTALDRALEVGRNIAAHPQHSLRLDRAAVYGGLGTPLEEGLEMEKYVVGPGLMHEEAKEGIERFRAREA